MIYEFGDRYEEGGISKEDYYQKIYTPQRRAAREIYEWIVEASPKMNSVYTEEGDYIFPLTESNDDGVFNDGN